MERTHTCGELRKKDVDNSIIIQGWVHTSRNHGGLLFINLRDRYGVTQTLIDPNKKILFEKAEKIRRESVIEVTGKVVARKEGMANPGMPTGDIEVDVENIKVLAESDILPIDYQDPESTTEESRMRYRYLDLRRPEMQKKFMIRHAAALSARKILSDKGFLEIETPLLVKSTPEGARDYVVPSRVNPGLFYALPQSPQLYKQILMVCGFDRYFQLPRCLRDEDLRTDRQPEHTQIDIEMSFPDLEDLWSMGETLIKNIFKDTINIDIKIPFERIDYKESMDRYGIDKPDIRFDLFLEDITAIAKESEFGVFQSVIKDGGIVKCVCAKAEFSRKNIDAYTKFAQQEGAKGLVWLKVTDAGLEGSVAKFFSDKLQKKIITQLKAEPGSIIFAVADSIKMTNHVLARIRNKLGKELKLYDPKEFRFCWINDFPLFEWSEEDERWEPAHHMFCMPFEDDMKYLETDPGKVHCTQFDMVLNGVELASGSIRINRPDVQERVMKVIGLTAKELEDKFGFLLEAFKYGAPPHGGFAIGFDRLVALMQGSSDIRDVIAFPKNKNAQCSMDGSPNELDAYQFKELHIKKDLPAKK